MFAHLPVRPGLSALDVVTRYLAKICELFCVAQQNSGVCHGILQRRPKLGEVAKVFLTAANAIKCESH